MGEYVHSFVGENAPTGGWYLQSGNVALDKHTPSVGSQYSVSLQSAKSIQVLPGTRHVSLAHTSPVEQQISAGPQRTCGMGQGNAQTLLTHSSPAAQQMSM